MCGVGDEGTGRAGLDKVTASPPAGKPHNWGRWGAEDERGAANFATADKIVAAARNVRKGKVYSLALQLGSQDLPVNPQRAAPTHLMSIDAGDFAAGLEISGGFCTADDYLAMYTQTGTHIDGLGHVWYGGALYNGFDANSVRSSGASRLGLEKLIHLTGRGVFLDVAGYRGVSSLAGGEVVTVADLEGAAGKAGLTVGEGDIVFVRTGWLETYSDAGKDVFWAANPGLGIEAGEWLGARGIAGIGVDNFAVEVHPSETGQIGPVHMRLIRDFGCYLMELVRLDELSADNVTEFLFVGAPLPLVGGTGSPLNPIAIT